MILHLKCSFASKNWSWPNWMNPACWRILLCNIYNIKRENHQLKLFPQLRETLLFLHQFGVPDIFLWECFSVPPRWGSGPLRLDGLPTGLGSDAPEGEEPVYTPLLKRPTPPYLREGIRNKEFRGSLWSGHKKTFISWLLSELWALHYLNAVADVPIVQSTEEHWVIWKGWQVFT